MADTSEKTPEPDADLQSRFPTAYTILFLLIILVAALTWIIPAGQYERAMNEEIGREVAVPGTFRIVEANPQGPIDVLMAPIAGFYDPDSYAANAIDVALFVLLLGGFLGVVNATGSIDTGMRSAMRSMQGRTAIYSDSCPPFIARATTRSSVPPEMVMAKGTATRNPAWFQLPAA